MSAIVVLKFPSDRIRQRAIGSHEACGVCVSMVRENVKRRPASKPVNKKRVRYIPDHRPLQAKWNELETARHLAQKKLASIAGASEGAVSQLLNGTTKLTIEWALQFAMYMDVSVIDIWPDFPFAKLVPGGLTPEEMEIALRFRMSKHKQAFKNLLRDLQGAS